MARYVFASVLLLVLFVRARGQTQIDLKAQSKNVDFTGAASTSPIKAGTALPSTCSVGQMYYLTNARAGSNLYGCTAVNVWTGEAGGFSTQSAVSGDVNGPLGAVVVTGIQGRPISTTAPTNGQAIVWNSTLNVWQPQTVATGGGAQTAGQLADLAVSLSSPTTLTIGAACSVATPCNARFGSLTYSLTTAASAVLSAGSGEAYVYLDSNGNLTVGHNLTASCDSGCRAVAGITAFPSNSLPLFTWTATNGTWDTSGGTDQRAFQSMTNVAAGTGLTGATANGLTTLSIDPTLVGVWAAVPATPSDACSTGSWSIDSSYFYICVSTNTWRRSALSAW